MSLYGVRYFRGESFNDAFAEKRVASEQLYYLYGIFNPQFWVEFDVYRTNGTNKFLVEFLIEQEEKVRLIQGIN